MITLEEVRNSGLVSQQQPFAVSTPQGLLLGGVERIGYVVRLNGQPILAFLQPSQHQAAWYADSGSDLSELLPQPILCERLSSAQLAQAADRSLGFLAAVVARYDDQLVRKSAQQAHQGSIPFLTWLLTPHAGSFPLSEHTWSLAKSVAIENWQSHLEEEERTDPVDLSGACWHVSLFVKQLFGGVVFGNAQHQANLIDGQIWDLCGEASSVVQLHALGPAYEHDLSYFGTNQHVQRLRGYMPIVQDWAKKFAERFDRPSVSVA